MNRRTRALQISAAVKRRVYERDGGRCVLCGAPGGPVAHYQSRAQGGLGIEENVVTLCRDCHRSCDQTAARPYLRRTLAEYLRNQYADWDDVRLSYRK